jgi:ribonuclease BN (tRNA processing enzyme)
MKLTILGSGTFQPELERHSSAYLIETGQSKICFDFGRGAIDQLLKAGIHPKEIDTIFISHWHADHIADLVPLFHIAGIPAPTRIWDPGWKREKPLKIYGPKGTLEKIGYMGKMIAEDILSSKNLEIRELGEEIIKGDDWQVKSFKTDHSKKLINLCYRLESQGKILVYSGDTINTAGLRESILDADVAIVEASWPGEVNPKTHLSGEVAGKIAQEQNVKKLILTHISPYYLEKFDPVSDAKKYFKGEVLLARDLMRIEI